MEFYNFIFQAWKVMEFEYGSWKMTHTQQSKQYLKKMIIFKYPENNFLILGHGKRPKIAGKGHGKSWKFIRLR